MRAAWLVVLAGCDGVFGLYPIKYDRDGGVTGDADAAVADDVRADAPACMTIPFSGAQTYMIGSQPRGIAAGDMDGNGTLDVIVANSGGPTIGIILGIGDGTFMPYKTYSTTDGTPTNLAVVNVDTDNDLDVVVVTASGLNVMEGTGAGALQTRRAILASTSLQDVAAGRLDNNSSIDLAYTAGTILGPLFNDGDGNFAGGQSSSTAAAPEDIAFADIDGDTDSDVVVASFSAPSIQVFSNSGGAFSGPDNYGTTNSGSPRGLVTGFINNDTDVDIAVVTTAGVNTWLGGSGASFNGGGLYLAPLAPGGIAIGDLDGDGDGDLAFTNATANTLICLINNGAGLVAQSPLPAGTNPGKLVIADFDNDGRNDIVVVNRDSNNVSVYLGCPP